MCWLNQSLGSLMAKKQKCCRYLYLKIFFNFVRNSNRWNWMIECLSLNIFTFIFEEFLMNIRTIWRQFPDALKNNKLKYLLYSYYSYILVSPVGSTEFIQISLSISSNSLINNVSKIFSFSKGMTSPWPTFIPTNTKLAPKDLL